MLYSRAHCVSDTVKEAPEVTTMMTRNDGPASMGECLGRYQLRTLLYHGRGNICLIFQTEPGYCEVETMPFLFAPPAKTTYVKISVERNLPNLAPEASPQPPSHTSRLSDTVNQVFIAEVQQ